MSSKERNDYNNYKKGKGENPINVPKKPVMTSPIGYFPMYNNQMPLMPPLQGMPMYPPFGRQMGGFSFNHQSTLQ